MNNRRNLLIALVAVPFTPRAVFAQAKKSPVVIGYLAGGSRANSGPNLGVFKEGMTALGWKEGAHYILEERWAEGRFERMQPLAEELIAKKPNIIVTQTRRATLAAANASQSIPIVQANGASPVEAGLAKSLARPGGMVTGLTGVPTEVSAKYLELLLAAAPKLKRVGFLLDLASSSYSGHMKSARSAIVHYRVEGRIMEIAKAEDIEPAIARLAKEGMEGLVILPNAGLFGAEQQRILTLASVHRWPVFGPGPSYPENGALLSYSPDSLALYRRAAYYVDRILKGAKPADLPIEQPMTFEMVVNLKTAKTLGLTLPPEIMVQATRVIQ